jgi:hypothetical protein
MNLMPIFVPEPIFGLDHQKCARSKNKSALTASANRDKNGHSASWTWAVEGARATAATVNRRRWRGEPPASAALLASGIAIEAALRCEVVVLGCGEGAIGGSRVNDAGGRSLRLPLIFDAPVIGTPRPAPPAVVGCEA